MAKSKTLTITREQSGRRWKLTIEGSDPGMRDELGAGIRNLAERFNAQIVNGSDPFGGQQMNLAPASGTGATANATDSDGTLPLDYEVQYAVVADCEAKG